MQAQEPNVRASPMKPLPPMVKTTLIALWVLGLLFTLASIITGIIVASYTTGSDRAIGFVAVWMALLLLVTSIYGTYVLRRMQSAFAVGLLVGIVGMLSQTGLILFSMFVGLAKQKSDNNVERSYNAMAAWSFLIFIVYSVFAIMCFAYRQDIIDPAQSSIGTKTMHKTSTVQAVSLPPPRASEESKIQDVTAGYDV